MAHGGRSGADELLAAELAAGKTVREAATAAGVSERTAHRRLESATFRARVAELHSALVRTAAGRLVAGMSEAADVLRAGLTHDDPHVRHKSATKLIELGVKVTELAELERRIAELEQRIPDREGANP